MRKKIITLLMAVALTVSMSMSAFAGTWEQDTLGWWYLEDDGSIAIGWKEINGKQYYFDGRGHMLQDTITPDGYRVGSDGAWINDGNEESRYGDYYLSHMSRTYGTQTAEEETYTYDGTEKYVLSNQNPYPYVLDYCIKGRIGEEEKDPNTWYVQDYDSEFHIEFIPLQDFWVSYWCADDGGNQGASYTGIINQWITFTDNNTFTITTEGRGYDRESYKYVATYTRIQ